MRGHAFFGAAIGDCGDELFLGQFLQRLNQGRADHTFLVGTVATLASGRTPSLETLVGLAIHQAVFNGVGGITGENRLCKASQNDRQNYTLHFYASSVMILSRITTAGF